MLAFSGYIWVVNNNDYTRQVQKIDPTTNSVVGTINLSSDGIYGAADLCTDGTWVYMVSVNYASQKGIARIDPSTLAVSYPFSSLSLPINATFVSCIYDPEGFLVICDYDNGCLYRINMYANTYFTIPVGGNPSDAILLNGYIYVACYDYYGTGSLYKICITPTVSPYKGKRIILETDNSERKFITDSKKKSFLVDIVRRVLK
jgi:DNA-binding beta-propeller fold protein YncE